MLWEEWKNLERGWQRKKNLESEKRKAKNVKLQLKTQNFKLYTVTLRFAF